MSRKYKDALTNLGILVKFPVSPTPLGGGEPGDREPMKHEEALRRLKTAEGHLRGIERMVEQEAYCIDVIHQIQAVQSALNKISAMVLEEHLNSCVITAIRGDNVNERERVLKEITGVFDAANKV